MRSAEEIKQEYALWLDNAHELKSELLGLDASALEDAFYRDLSFGTGGLRGLLGAGTNRINIYTVARASQGVADYVNKNFPPGRRAVAVGYDSRINSRLFSRVASAVFVANGIKTHIYAQLMPVPCLSYAVRALSCSAGVMITASHNPANYNGYKVYGSDGCQITTQVATEIWVEIEKLAMFGDVKRMDCQQAFELGLAVYIGSEVYDAYVAEIRRQSVLFGDAVDRQVSIVYSPLNGTGLKPVKQVLKEAGFANVSVVAEQEQPDGNFPTCPFPNPEIREAMSLGLDYCRRLDAGLLIATDPDCDRCGIAVRDGGDYRLLSGNEVGLLLLDFICAQRCRHHAMPLRPVFIKTIVTMDLAERIATHYGVETVNVLTGFKFIGEIIGRLERESRENDFICGFEESYGYLTGSYVRDKDGVNAVFMISEMFAFYQFRGISLLQKLQELYDSYGYCLNTLHSYEFEGSAGMRRMKDIMSDLRRGVNSIGDMRVESFVDYAEGVNGLPRSDVLEYRLEGGGKAVIRPSGTEPKLKVYLSVIAEDQAQASEKEKTIIAGVEKWLK